MKQLACLFLFMALGAFNLCTQTPTVKLASVTHLKPPYKDHWTYLDSIPTGIISTNHDSTSVIMMYQFLRNEANRLDRILVLDVAETPIYAFNYVYDEENKRVVEIDKYADLNYDGSINELDHSFSFAYDSLGRVNKIKIFKYDQVSRNLNFTWSDGNVVTVENNEGEMNYMLFLEYDDKPNVLEPIKWEYLATTGNLELFVLLFSKNNLISARIHPTTMDEYSLNIKAEYDENGLYLTNNFELVEFGYRFN